MLERSPFLRGYFWSKEDLWVLVYYFLALKRLAYI